MKHWEGLHKDLYSKFSSHKACWNVSFVMSFFTLDDCNALDVHYDHGVRDDCKDDCNDCNAHDGSDLCDIYDVCNIRSVLCLLKLKYL